VQHVRLDAGSCREGPDSIPAQSVSNFRRTLCRRGKIFFFRPDRLYFYPSIIIPPMFHVHLLGIRQMDDGPISASTFKKYNSFNPTPKIYI